MNTLGAVRPSIVTFMSDLSLAGSVYATKDFMMVPEIHKSQTIFQATVPVTGVARVPVQLIIPLAVGDVVDFTSVTQVTTPYTGNIMVGRYATVGGLSTVGGLHIVRPMTTNFNEDIHHLPVPMSAKIEITPEMVHDNGNYYIRQIVYAASSIQGSTSWSLPVDYVDMQVSVWRLS